eukprot:6213688-Pleurochrysis_carterae.AAC.3
MYVDIVDHKDHASDVQVWQRALAIAILRSESTVFRMAIDLQTLERRTCNISGSPLRRNGDGAHAASKGAVNILWRIPGLKKPLIG